jgi:hypothetical protein
MDKKAFIENLHNVYRQYAPQLQLLADDEFKWVNIKLRQFEMDNSYIWKPRSAKKFITAHTRLLANSDDFVI